MPLGTRAKLLTLSKSLMLQNSENTALNTGLTPFISRASLMQHTCFKGVAGESIIKQSQQINGFMTAEFPKANPLVKAPSCYFQKTVCNQIQAGLTAPNQLNLTIFLLSAYSHLTLQVGSSSDKNSFFPPRFSALSSQFRIMHKSSAFPSTSSSFPLFPNYLLHPIGRRRKPRLS